MDFGLDGVVVLVTGSSSRIGRATAKAFAVEGARTVVTYRDNEEGAERTALEIEEAGGTARALRLDQGDPQSIERALGAVSEMWGPVGVLVNNAVAWPGFPVEGEVFETAPVERFEGSLRNNLVGPYLVSRGVVEGMRQVGWGRIVHLSTGLVEDGMPGTSAYVAAKAGLHGLARTMSRELARFGIFTNVVLPGFTRERGEARELPPRVAAIEASAARAAATRRLTRPEDVASLVVYLGSRANGHVTGEAIRVDGHFLAPSLVGTE